MATRGVCRCEECLLWDHEAVGDMGICRLEGPRINRDGRGVWPRTAATEGCHQGIQIPRTTTGKGTSRDEIAWRLAETWSTHLEARCRWFASKGLTMPEPALNKQIREAIVRALNDHDRDLLGPDQRVEWKKRSRVRGAGIGLFLSPYHCGENEQGKRYLEPWRPWVPQSGKPEPVTTFSELWFRMKAGDKKA